MLAAQRIGVEELQETPQFLPGVATRVSAGQFAAEHSRAAPQFQHSRLIVITSLDANERSRYAFALEGLPVVHKPQLVQELPALLRAMLA